MDQMQDTDQMLINDVRRLDRAIAHRKSLLAKKVAKGLVFPRCYVVDVPIVGHSNITLLEQVSRAFVVERTCRLFCCQEIVATTALQGDVTPPGGTVAAGRVTASAFIGSVAGGTSAVTNSVLCYEWQVRDTFSDRAWQSHFTPNLVIAGGKTGPFRMCRPAKLPPGTEVEITINPLFTPTTYGVVTGITGYSVQVSFIGYEVL